MSSFQSSKLFKVFYTVPLRGNDILIWEVKSRYDSASVGRLTELRWVDHAIPDPAKDLRKYFV